MHVDWKELTKGLLQPLRELRVGSPDAMKSFSAITQAALRPGVFDAKSVSETACVV
jgi:hypothetical protein